MIEVTREQFFAAVHLWGNVHPRPERHCSMWEMPDRRVMGKSTPGYSCEGEKAWFLTEAALQSLNRGGASHA